MQPLWWLCSSAYPVGLETLPSTPNKPLGSCLVSLTRSAMQDCLRTGTAALGHFPSHAGLKAAP